jgi:hypothetical protein
LASAAPASLVERLVAQHPLELRGLLAPGGRGLDEPGVAGGGRVVAAQALLEVGIAAA